MVRAAFLGLILLSPIAAFGQGAAPAAKPEMNETCPGLVAQERARIVPAAFRVAALKDGEARINYIGHSTFLIESPRLVRIATDYNLSLIHISEPTRLLSISYAVF